MAVGINFGSSKFALFIKFLLLMIEIYLVWEIAATWNLLSLIAFNRMFWFNFDLYFLFLDKTIFVLFTFLSQQHRTFFTSYLRVIMSKKGGITNLMPKDLTRSGKPWNMIILLSLHARHERMDLFSHFRRNSIAANFYDGF